MFRLLLIKNDQSATYDITPLTNDIAWDSGFSITVSLEFMMANSDTDAVPVNPCEIGDLVILTQEDYINSPTEKEIIELYRGVIVEEQRNGRDPIKYISYDYTWYLNQSTTVYQFNSVSATEAIRKVLTDFGIQIESIIEMPTKINEIYMLKTPGKIIQDIIDQVEKKEGYRISAEMRYGKLVIRKRIDLVIAGFFELAENVQRENILEAVGNPSRTRSIESMRNRIRLIVDDEETEYQVTAEKEDTAMIGRYGLIEETIKIEAEDAAKSRQVAMILLNRLSKVHETITLKFIGNTLFRGGRLFDVVESVTGISGRYMIVEAKHRINKKKYTMELELALPEDVV
ncbi:XkdQ/YqbQ family protein [Tindallia californiensis]|uniref:YqbQ/XkdQ domain-containing protein n=1 Tax=Tindallia californiensis TaxID=159292 RepID=A0A1H3R1Q8_9FIRM|nr:hypothetical protein [Tindallia californiensis]SDZ19443.1 hypothetical protein SAMN05192546_11182 [Tindallia californiensis]